jgi:hypothetical protein
LSYSLSISLSQSRYSSLSISYIINTYVVDVEFVVVVAVVVTFVVVVAHFVDAIVALATHAHVVVVIADAAACAVAF